MQLHVTTRARTGGCDIGQWSQRTISFCDSVAVSQMQLPAASVTIAACLPYSVSPLSPYL